MTLAGTVPHLAEQGADFGVLGKPAFILLREDDRAIHEHVVLALRAFLDRGVVSRVVQLGRETRGPDVIAVSDGAVLDQDERHGANLPVDSARPAAHDRRR